MRVAILGRTRWLLDSALALAAAGHSIGFVATSKAASHDPTQPDDFADLADRFAAPFLRTADLDAPASLKQLQDCGCEIGLSINWNRILAAAISALPGGILNVHAGDLPRYRGNAPVNWAILNGEPHVGLCLHRMIAGVVDDGEVITRMRYQLTHTTYVGDVFAWLDTAIPKLVVEGFESIANRRTGAKAGENTSGTTRCFPRRPEDSRIDWNQSASVIHRLIRASSEPFSGAFTTLDTRETVRIWRADPFDWDGDFLAMPGQVMIRSEGFPVIACGQGCLILRKVSIDGMDDSDAALAAIGKSLRNRLV